MLDYKVISMREKLKLAILSTGWFNR